MIINILKKLNTISNFKVDGKRYIFKKYDEITQSITATNITDPNNMIDEVLDVNLIDKSLDIFHYVFDTVAERNDAIKITKEDGTSINGLVVRANSNIISYLTQAPTGVKYDIIEPQVVYNTKVIITILNK